MNILVFESKSLIVIQLTEEVEFTSICSEAKFSTIYTANFLLNIRYYSRLNGGGKLIPEHDIDNVFQTPLWHWICSQNK
jgi:hypothetical protein